jgi:hypothetical protein
MFQPIYPVLKKTIVSISILLSILADLNAQCVAVGPNSPSGSSDDPSIGTTAWVNTGNIFASDNSYATVTALILGNKSNYLVATNFGFAIPSTATICGITVEIEKNATGLLQTINDNSVKIVKGGSICGAENALGGTWPTTDTYFTYGGAGNLWGTTWLYSDINAANFGVAISANLSGLSVLPSARVDHVRITVYYDNPLPIELLNFNASRINKNSVNLSWTTASETNNDFFTIERTLDGNNWEERGRFDGTKNSRSRINYSFNDTNSYDITNYYRLKQTDYDGRFRYSQIVAAPSARGYGSNLNIYPNPSNGVFTIQFSEKISRVEIINLFGEIIYVSELNSDSMEIKIDLSYVRKEFYFIKIKSFDKFTTKTLIIQ